MQERSHRRSSLSAAVFPARERPMKYSTRLRSRAFASSSRAAADFVFRSHRRRKRESRSIHIPPNENVTDILLTSRRCCAFNSARRYANLVCEVLRCCCCIHVAFDCVYIGNGLISGLCRLVRGQRGLAARMLLNWWKIDAGCGKADRGRWLLCRKRGL